MKDMKMKGYKEERQQGRRDIKELSQEGKKKTNKGDSLTHLHHRKGWDRPALERQNRDRRQESKGTPGYL